MRRGFLLDVHLACRTWILGQVVVGAAAAASWICILWLSWEYDQGVFPYGEGMHEGTDAHADDRNDDDDDDGEMKAMSHGRPLHWGFST